MTAPGVFRVLHILAEESPLYPVIEQLPPPSLVLGQLLNPILI